MVLSVPERTVLPPALVGGVVMAGATAGLQLFVGDAIGPIGGLFGALLGLLLGGVLAALLGSFTGTDGVAAAGWGGVVGGLGLTAIVVVMAPPSIGGLADAVLVGFGILFIVAWAVTFGVLGGFVGRRLAALTGTATGREQPAEHT
jgi:hypothetical protein